MHRAERKDMPLFPSESREMDIQIIRSSSSIGLDARGAVGSPISAPACQLAGTSRSVPEREGVRAGVWECTPGEFRRDVKAAEIMHILSGSCTFVPDGKDPMEITAGDTVILPAMTTGVWTIKDTLRKVYVLID
jgi:uncharacterized cupin superfamily protein